MCRCVSAPQHARWVTNLKALFAHDHRFVRGDGAVYSESQFPSSLWTRYLLHFDELVVFARAASGPVDRAKAEVSSAERVSFVLGPSLSSVSSQVLRKREAKRLLHEALHGVDAVIARLPSENGLLAVAEARKAGIPYAVELAGCPWDGLWNYGTFRGKLYAPIMTARVRAAVAQASHVVYVTQQFLQSRYPNSGGVSIACSNVEIGECDRAVLSDRMTRIQAGKRPFVLGLIGTLKTRYKGIQTVLAALPEIRKQVPHIEFRVLGAGDVGPWEREAGRLGVADIVRFEGALPGGSPVLRWLDGIDLYLQPSFKEGLPRALIEAMSRGCPAVASTCAGIPELLDEECLIRPGDALHLRKLIVGALTDTAWQMQQAERNWQCAREYSSSILDARRHDFWAAVAASVRGKNNDA